MDCAEKSVKEQLERDHPLRIRRVTLTSAGPGRLRVQLAEAIEVTPPPGSRVRGGALHLPAQQS